MNHQDEYVKKAYEFKQKQFEFFAVSLEDGQQNR